MLDQAFDPTQRGRPLPQLYPRGRADCRRISALCPHRQHAAEPAAHLAGGKGMLGASRQTGIQHFFHPRCCDNPSATCWAFRHACLTRRGRVRMPRSNSQASKLPRTAPQLFRTLCRRCQYSSCRALVRHPARTSEWPFRYLVAACMTMSAPSASRSAPRAATVRVRSRDPRRIPLPDGRGSGDVAGGWVEALSRDDGWGLLDASTPATRLHDWEDREIRRCGKN